MTYFIQPTVHNSKMFSLPSHNDEKLKNWNQQMLFDISALRMTETMNRLSKQLQINYELIKIK